MSLTVRIPFVYGASMVTEAGDPVDRRYVETVEFELRESPKAPVALVCHKLTGHYGHPRQGDPLRFRLVDGVLYQPETTYRHGEGDVPLMADDPRLQEVLTRVFVNENDFVAAASQVRLKGPPNPKRTERSMREEILRKVTAIGEGLLAIDGHVHRAVSEPRLLARNGVVVVRQTVQDDEAKHEFRLDRMSDAIRRAAVLGAVAENKVSVPNVEIRDGSWITDIDHDRAFLQLAKDALGGFAIGAEKFTTTAVDAFCDLRDAVCWQRYGQDDIPDLAKAYAALEDLVVMLQDDHRLAAVVALARDVLHMDRLSVGSRVSEADDALADFSL